MESRQKRAQETKQKLLDTAERLMQESNSLDISVDDIVAECGVAKGTFYHHFQSKDDLLLQLSYRQYQNLRQRYYDNQGDPFFISQLKKFILAWYDQSESLTFPQFSSHIFYQYAGKTKEAESPITGLEYGTDIIQECLRGAVEAGELLPGTPVDSLALTLIFILHGSMLHKRKYDANFDIARWSKTFVDTFLDGLLKQWMPEPDAE